MGKVIDLTGQKFGRLTVIERADVRSHRREIVWRCVCDCGNMKDIPGYSLRSGMTSSCGCWKSEVLANFKIRSTTHGLYHHPLHGIWNGMKIRCYDKNRKQYKNYGGRGIEVCDEWKNDFKAFYDWAMANGYQKGLSIDRIDNDGDYCPENCRWADNFTQANNSRQCHYIQYDGRTHMASTVRLRWHRIALPRG